MNDYAFPLRARGPSTLCSADNDVDAQEVRDNDGAGTVWCAQDHWGNDYGTIKSPTYGAVARKAIGAAAKNDDRSALEAATVAAVGQTWFTARSVKWKNRWWQGWKDEVGSWP